MKVNRIILLASFALAWGCKPELVDKKEEPNATIPASHMQAAATVTSGAISVLSYNIAGLPLGISDADPAKNTPIIGQLIHPYDVVHVQEDFNFHASLYEADNHPYRTPTSGGAAFGDGLNTLSAYPISDFQRVKWSKCNGTDCLTPKGFTFSRIRLAEGVYLDFYNAHPNASTEEADLAARRANITQLSQFITQNSGGNAVVVMGDMNCRYTRSGDNIRELIQNNGLTDVWIQLIRNNNYPALGAPALVCDKANLTNACEVVDKIFYRSSAAVTLTATGYQLNDPDFVNNEGENLSDHYPVFANFTWNLVSRFRLSDWLGGPHGTPFTDVSQLPAGVKPTTFFIRAGERVDQVAVQLTNGAKLAHGGTGGTEKFLTLAAGEYIREIQLCAGKKDNRTRIFYAELRTSTNRILSGGTKTSDVATYTAPAGYQIAGFHGRSGNGVDKLGVVYIPR